MTVVHDVPRIAEATLLTPLGRGAVASIEVSGPEAIDCVERCFLPASGMSMSAVPIGQIVYGRWGSATGEEIVACRLNDFTIELHCHGGHAAATRILADLSSHGAVVQIWRAAVERKQGESIRAAAIVALSESTTVRTTAILWEQYAGAFERALQDVLTMIRGGETSTVVMLVAQLLARADLGLHLTSPWRVALIGPPNVGKSSLLNALLGYGRAIVHDQPGTTRDLVTGATAFDGWPCLLVDTAGLRDTEDLVESAGVELTTEALREADLVLWVRDATSSSSEDAIWRVAIPETALIVWNKCDLLADTRMLRPAGVCISALTRQGIDDLVRTIAARLVPSIPPPGSAVPFTQEQVERLRRIQTAIEQGLAIEAANDLDQWLAVQVHGALPGEICG